MKNVPALLLAPAALVLAAAPSPVLAQESAEVDEALAYAAWRAAYDASESAKAITLATDYMKKYPKGKYSDYLGKWLAQQGVAVQTPLQEAIAAGNTKLMAQLGRDHMKAQPEDVTTAIQLAWHLRKDLKLAGDIDSFSRQAIKLVEAGKAPAGSGFDKKQTLAWLYQNLALVASQQKKTDEALKQYAKSNSMAPGNAGINGTNLRAMGRLHLEKYNAAAAKVGELQAAAAAQAEIDAANATVAKEGDAVIESWGRLLALAQSNSELASITKGIREALNGVYAQRHPDDPSGLDAQIQSYRQ